ncbi:hypothetical protein A5624_02780 [Mycobacterium sp. 1482292.6]|nr:hypothetical protein A5624_02780 [Mycobacterium sp. 1482292.6]
MQIVAFADEDVVGLFVDLDVEVAGRAAAGPDLTLRGHGMPHLRSGTRGDLHVHVEVVVPARLDHRDTELLREFKTRRNRDVPEVRSTHAGGGLFSRLRETFTGR